MWGHHLRAQHTGTRSQLAPGCAAQPTPDQMPNSSLRKPLGLCREKSLCNVLLMLKIISRRLCTRSKLSQGSSHRHTYKWRKIKICTILNEVENFFSLKENSIMLKCVLLPQYSQISTFFAYSDKNLILKI